MSKLTTEERENLAQLQAGMSFMPPQLQDVTQRSGRALADALRSAHADIDDVTIAQVALSLGGYLGRLATSHEMVAAGNAMLIAALELTAAERATPDGA